MDIINPAIQSYAESYSNFDDELLREIEEYTIKHHPESQMLSGKLQGKLLEMISRMIQPSRILEIGTFMGFSGICLAKGLAKNGMLHTIELRENDAAVARQNFQRSYYNDRIILHVGNALEIIPRLAEEWDLVFIDADKTGYMDYFNLVLPKLRKNGFILADNILFHGEVVESEPKGKNAKAIIAFNNEIRERQDIDFLVLTIRDGLYLIRKK